jgi:hypothetical protein
MWTNALGHFAAAVVAAYAIAALAPVLATLLPRSARRWMGWALLPAIEACILLIPPERVGFRAGAAYLVNEVAFKVVDWFGRERRPGLREYFRFLIPFPTLAVVFPYHKRRLAMPDDPWRHLVALILGPLVVAASITLLLVAKHVEVLRTNFALDHTVKFLLFIPTVEAISRMLFALERLAGFDTSPIIRNAFLSRTPAEFWRRYNVRVHDWMLRNVYASAGGRRAPVRGVVAVFLVSAALHEVMFGIATSRFDGSQFLFFLLQIPAVLLSGPLERFADRAGAPGRILAHTATIVFFAVTSVLFFQGMSRVFPIVYAG